MDWYDFKEFFGVMALIAAVFVIVIVTVAIPCALVARASCLQFAEINSELDVQWRLWAGCLVRTPQGIYVPTDDYAYIFGNLDVRTD